MKDEYAGKTGKCPACQAIFTVAAPALLGTVADTSTKAAAHRTRSPIDESAGSKATESTPPPPVRKPAVREPQVFTDFEVIEETEPIRTAPSNPGRAVPSSSPLGGPNRSTSPGFEVIDDEAVDDVTTRAKTRRDPWDDEDVDDEDRRLRRGSPGDWHKVHLGLTLVYYSICSVLAAVGILFVALYLILIIVGIFGPSAGEVVDPDSLKSLRFVVGIIAWITLPTAAIGFLGGIVLYFIGLAMGCWAPSRHSAKTLATILLCMASLHLLVGMAHFPMHGPVRVVLGFVSNGLAMATSLLFLFYLRALALNLKARDHALGIRNVIIGMGAFAGLQLAIALTLALTSAANSVEGWGGGAAERLVNAASLVAGLGYLSVALAFALAILGLVIFCWFMNVLIGFIKFIERRKVGDGDWNDVPTWLPLFAADVVFLAIFIIIVIVRAVSGDYAPTTRFQPPAFHPPPQVSNPFIAPRFNPNPPIVLPPTNPNPVMPPINNPPFARPPFRRR